MIKTTHAPQLDCFTDWRFWLLLIIFAGFVFVGVNADMTNMANRREECVRQRREFPGEPCIW